MSTPPKLILASASPARLRLLRSAGIDPEVMISGVDESNVQSSSAAALCATLSRLKAELVVERLRHHAPAADPGLVPAIPPTLPQSTGQTLVLGCDSVLEFDGQIFGKPVDEADAVSRWHRMRGQSGILHTGHCLIDLVTEKLAEEVADTEVRFANLSDMDLAAYVATGEPLQVAGAFTIDGLGAWFIEGINGDPGTVIGLSLPVLRRLLAEHGHSVAQFWSSR